VFHGVRFEVLRRQRNRISLLRLTPITAANVAVGKAIAAEVEGERKGLPAP
jgi:hypothetical protein